MINREYRFKFYLNARHAIKIDNKINNVHPHTWEFNLFLQKTSDKFIQFSVIERELEFFLSMYEGNLLNEIPPFNLVEPSLENIGEIIYEQIKRIMSANEWTLLRLEISENPSRTYIIYEDNKEPTAYLELRNKEEQIALEENAVEEYAAAVEEEPAVEEKLADNLHSHPNMGNYIDSNEVTRISRKDRRKSKGKRRKNNDQTSSLQANQKTSGIFQVIKDVIFNPIFRNILVVLLSSIPLILYITRKGYYPWGADTLGHLFKAHFLYEELIKGNFYPAYTELWYNGVQPFRYWAPLPYFILALFEFISNGNSMLSYNIFIVFSFILGALGWILWGRKTGRHNLALVFALLWFFMPDNARVFFSEGNIPRVLVTNIFPFLLLYIWDYVENRKRSSMIAIVICMFFITLSHAMIAAMAAIAATIFILIYGVIEKKAKASFEAIFALVIGIALSGFWLYPALKGGLVSMDPDAVSSVMETLTFPLAQSLNPAVRLLDNGMYYFGLPVFIISLFGAVFGNKESRSGFVLTLIILAGTTKALLFLFEKIPMGQLFWMMRFTPLAYGAFFVGLFLWKKARKSIVLAAILMLTADCLVSAKILCYDNASPRYIADEIQPAINVASQRVAMLDCSEYSSSPSYYLAYNENNKKLSQVYGWAWQGATTSKDIVWINTALEKGWYTFMFDRCLEMGADTLVVKKAKVTDKADLLEKGTVAGYKLVRESAESYIFKYPVNSQFGTKVKYSGLGIGKYSSNLSFIFPSIEVGGSEYLDNYSAEELSNYKFIFLSGFKYKDRVKAENLVKQISEKGVKVIIDMTGAESDLSSSRAEFLGVRAQPVLIKDRFPVLQRGENKLTLTEIPEEYKDWNTIYLENLDNTTGEIEFNHQFMSFLGSKVNKNITFLGLNLPFYGTLTKDEAVIAILEDVLGINAGEKPYREIVKIDVKREGNKINILSDKEGTVFGMAKLDAFNISKGNISEVHSLVKLEGNNAEIEVKTPYTKAGTIISFIGIIMLIGFIFRLKNQFSTNKMRSLGDVM